MTVFSALQILNMSLHCFLACILSKIISCILNLSFLVSFNVLHLSLFFYSLVITYLVNLFEFILLKVHWSWWMCRLMFSPNLGIWGHYYFKYSFYSISFLLSFWTPLMHRLICLLSVPQLSEALFIFLLLCVCVSKLDNLN